MKLVIFGLTISSSFGNGHATLLRGLFRALAGRGHRVVFFERDVEYYAAHRDLWEMPGVELVLYPEWTDEVVRRARGELGGADVGMVTSYCPDGIAATDLVIESKAGVRAFYDLDTPVTLDALRAGLPVSYVGPRGLRDFDVVLSYTGGAALDELREQLGARRVAPLYGSVDPEIHRPVAPIDAYRANFSYLGTYAGDRQPALERLFLEPARQMPEKRFLIGGSKYPQDFPWGANVFYVMHVPPAAHPAFYCSSRWTLNVTRRAMAEMGYCPSGRLFEAAACGAPVLSDWWEGLDQFFTPGAELVVARTTEDVVDALSMTEEEAARVGRAARERALAEHTAEHRAVEVEGILDGASRASSGADAGARADAVAGVMAGSRAEVIEAGTETRTAAGRVAASPAHDCEWPAEV